MGILFSKRNCHGSPGGIAFLVAILFTVAAPVRAMGQIPPVTNSSNSAATTAPASSVELKEPKRVAAWDHLLRGTIGGGYRDNVMRTAVAPESSPFINSSAEASFIRLSETGAQLSFFLFAEDWRYTDCADVNSEQMALVTAQALWPVKPRQELEGEVQYIYQNLVVDLSETEADLRRLLVEGHGISARPRWRWELQPAWSLQLEGTAMRQDYMTKDVDDYWEAAGKLSLIRKIGKNSEVSGFLQSTHRLFDTWEQYDSEGESIPGSDLEYWRPEVSSQFRHFWDRGRQWRTTTRLSWLGNHDNGSGYYDYDRFTVYHQLRWAGDTWEVKATGRAGWYWYDIQKVNGHTRERSYVSLDLRVERRIGKYFFLYGVAEREWNYSNDPLDEYRDWAASAGIGANF